MCNLLWFSITSQGNSSPGENFFMFIRDSVGHTGIDGSGANTIDCDIFRSKLYRKRARKPYNT